MEHPVEQIADGFDYFCGSIGVKTTSIAMNHCHLFILEIVEALIWAEVELWAQGSKKFWVKMEKYVEHILIMENELVIRNHPY